MATATPARPEPTRFDDENPPVAAEPGGFYEVVGGHVVEKPAMGAYEAEIASLIQTALDGFGREQGLGRAVTEALFLLDPAAGLRRRPDVAFVSAGRWPLDSRAPRAAAWEVVPDLAVEVVSPTNLSADDVARLDDYFRAGVRRAWFVYPNVARVYDYDGPASVAILGAGQALDGGDVLPGFSLPLATLFGA